MHIGEASDVCNWIQSGRDCKNYKCKEDQIKMMQTEYLIVRAAKLDIEIKSDWLLICFTFVMKSPGNLVPKFKKRRVLRDDKNLSIVSK